MLLAGLPAADCHLQGVVGGEQSGQQREVGHGTGAVLGVDPALDGFSFVRVSVYGGKFTQTNTCKCVHTGWF